MAICWKNRWSKKLITEPTLPAVSIGSRHPPCTRRRGSGQSPLSRLLRWETAPSAWRRCGWTVDTAQRHSLTCRSATRHQRRRPQTPPPPLQERGGDRRRNQMCAIVWVAFGNSARSLIGNRIGGSSNNVSSEEGASKDAESDALDEIFVPAGGKNLRLWRLENSNFLSR